MSTITALDIELAYRSIDQTRSYSHLMNIDVANLPHTANSALYEPKLPARHVAMMSVRAAAEKRDVEALRKAVDAQIDLAIAEGREQTDLEKKVWMAAYLVADRRMPMSIQMAGVNAVRKLLFIDG